MDVTYRFFVVTCLGASLIVAASQTVQAQPETIGQDQSDVRNALRNADLYEVPESALPEQLASYITSVIEFQPQTFAEFQLHAQHAPVAIETACNKIQELGIDPERLSYRVSKIGIVVAHAMRIPFETADFHQTVVEELKAIVDEFGADNETFAVSKRAIRAIQHAGNKDLAVAASKTLGATFAAADDSRIGINGQRMLGTARRLEIEGKKIEVFGTTLEGTEFDWESYRGSVVLVYFWSTGVGPSEAEMPQLVQLENQFKDRGFQIVAVSLDFKKQVVEEFLSKRDATFTCLFDEFAGWEHPLALEYGVDELPMTFLVDEQGVVVASGERIPKVTARLQAIFGSGGQSDQ